LFCVTTLDLKEQLYLWLGYDNCNSSAESDSLTEPVKECPTDLPSNECSTSEVDVQYISGSEANKASLSTNIIAGKRSAIDDILDNQVSVIY